MPNYLEKIYETTLPVAVLREGAAFPLISSTFELSDRLSQSAAEAAETGGGRVFLVSEALPSEGEPAVSGLYNIGTVAKIKQSIRTPEGKLRILAEGQVRASVAEYKFSESDAYISAELICKTILVDGTSRIYASFLSTEPISRLRRICVRRSVHLSESINSCRIYPTRL